MLPRLLRRLHTQGIVLCAGLHSRAHGATAEVHAFTFLTTDNSPPGLLREVSSCGEGVLGHASKVLFI